MESLSARYDRANHYIDHGLIRLDAETSDPQRTRRDWMLWFLPHIGQPQHGIPAIHVTGTSGKGSVAMMIAEILRAHGLRVGLHVSPYLQVATEKLWVDGRYASVDEYEALVAWIRPICERLRGPEVPLHGLASVALCLEYFRRQAVDVIVMEAPLCPFRVRARRPASYLSLNRLGQAPGAEASELAPERWAVLAPAPRPAPALPLLGPWLPARPNPCSAPPPSFQADAWPPGRSPRSGTEHPRGAASTKEYAARRDRARRRLARGGRRRLPPALRGPWVGYYHRAATARWESRWRWHTSPCVHRPETLNESMIARTSSFSFEARVLAVRMMTRRRVRWTSIHCSVL